MEKLKKLAVFVSAAIGIGGFLFFQNIHAAATFTMELEVYNPGAAVSSGVVARFNFPACLTPLSFGSGISWDLASRVLTVQVGSLGQNQTKAFPIQAESASEGCVAAGAIAGEWFIQPSSGSSSVGSPEQPAPEQPVTEEPVSEPVTDLEPAPEEVLQPEEASPPPAELGFTVESHPSSGSIFGGGGGGYVNIGFLPPVFNEIIGEFRAIPEIVSGVETVSAPLALVTETVATGVVAVNAFSAGSHIFLSWVNQIRVFLLAFIRRKKIIPWGRIYNELTGRSVQGATVSIIDVEFQKVKETQFTDAEGRFGFLVSPGAYYLKILKTGFETKETGRFQVGEDPSRLNLQIGVTEFGGLPTRAGLWAVRLFHFINNILYRLNPVILFIGTTISAAGFLIIPNRVNLVILVVYALLDILKMALAFKTVRSYGLVMDKNTKMPLSLSVVRLFNVDANWLMGTRVADNDGRYNFLLMPGKYYLTCVRDRYREYKSGILEIKKTAISTQTIEMELAMPESPATDQIYAQNSTS